MFDKRNYKNYKKKYALLGAGWPQATQMVWLNALNKLNYPCKWAYHFLTNQDPIL